MKLKIESDLHISILDYFEHDEYIPDLKDIDVYLVSEICEEKFSRNWLINLCKNNPQTIIIEVPSNHLPYRDNIEKCHNRRLELMESLPNYRFLENDSCIINGIRFIGACLWTDMNNRDERVVHYVWSKMNDYHKIRYTENYLKLSPYRTIKLFECSRDYIFKTLNNSKEPCVVLTHHQPLITEVKDNLSYAYMSNLDKYFNNCINLPLIWASGHCFSDNVELLTKRGWIKGFDLKEDDLVGTMNKETRLFEWNKINKFYNWSNYKELYRLKGDNYDISLTNRHGLIVEDTRGGLIETTPESITSLKTNNKFILAVNNSNDMYNINDNLLRLLINICADGSIEGNAIRFHLKKERKILHLTYLLNSLGIKYTISKQKSGTTKIYIGVKSSKNIINKFFNNKIKKLPSFIKDLNKHQADIVINEYLITDGTSYNNGGQICSKKEEEIDILQEMCVKNGYRSSKLNRGTYFVLSVYNSKTSIFKNKNISKVPYSGEVWCINVDNGTLITRSNGKTIITLNTHISHDIIKEYNHGSVRFISNQRGYPSEYDEVEGINKTGFDKDFILEVGE